MANFSYFCVCAILRFRIFALGLVWIEYSDKSQYLADSARFAESALLKQNDLKKISKKLNEKFGREEGIRTLESLHFTRVPGVLLQPLGHLSIFKNRNTSRICFKILNLHSIFKKDISKSNSNRAFQNKIFFKKYKHCYKIFSKITPSMPKFATFSISLSFLITSKILLSKKYSLAIFWHFWANFLCFVMMYFAPNFS